MSITAKCSAFAVYFNALSCFNKIVIQENLSVRGFSTDVRCSVAFDHGKITVVHVLSLIAAIMKLRCMWWH